MKCVQLSRALSAELSTEKMSDRCHFPSGDPIHTKPTEHALCMKAGPSTLAKASGDLQSRRDSRLDPLHMDQEDLFWAAIPGWASLN